MRVLRCGDHAVIVELADLEQVLGLYRGLRESPPHGSAELVPAARTILVHYDPNMTTKDKLAHDIAATPPASSTGSQGRLVEVPTRYDGADLSEVAALAGLSPREVAQAHSQAEYLAAFGGFSPGFCYLTGLPEPLRLPRRSTPRTRVPAGAVALGGGYTAVYPRESPGGWHLIGHTDMAMWDTGQDPPAVLEPGTRVRFVEAGTC